MEKLQEIKEAQNNIKRNRIHPNDVKSVYGLISNDKNVSMSEMATKILEYKT